MVFEKVELASQSRVAIAREPEVVKEIAGAGAPAASAVPSDAAGEELVRRKAAEGVKTWRVAQTLEGHTGPVWCLVVVEVRNILISGSSDTTIKIWDIFTFKCRHTLVTLFVSLMVSCFVDSHFFFFVCFFFVSLRKDIWALFILCW